jgi:hypothetical protein
MHCNVSLIGGARHAFQGPLRRYLKNNGIGLRFDEQELSPEDLADL